MDNLVLQIRRDVIYNGSMRIKSGFTLIEVLVVVVIMGIILAGIAFAVRGARGNANDNRRKADLATIASGLEKYRSDCGVYPSESQFNGVAVGGNLAGDGSTPVCTATSIYISGKPGDLERPTRVYSYSLLPNSHYVLCASLEAAPTPTMNVGSCALCVTACNYVVTSP